ncbi:mechanosensitive ion channel [Candidatus Woesearchaeota archaeon]|nr:mechanosensitive ion channel [Candidatus Woesearchaeota archaeon]
MNFSVIWENIINNKYLIGLSIFVIFYVVAELMKFITEGVFIKFAKKTKTELDDFFIKKTKRPFSFLLMFIGIRLAFVIIDLNGKVGDVVNNIINSVIVIIAIYIGITLLKLLIEFWGENFAERTKSEVDEHLISVIKKSLTVVFFIAVFLGILQVWGIEIGPLLAGLGIGGVAIAFALQKTLGNVFGGISMIFDRSISVGDVVVLDNDLRGEIVDIGLRSTKVKTFDNEFIIVPNGKLSEMNIHNVAKPEPSVRIIIPFGVKYGSKVDKVKKTVLKAIDKLEYLDRSTKDKKPLVRFMEMGDSALLFKAYFYIKSYKDRYEAIDQSTTMIYNALNKAKISIPFPQMDVHVKKR